MKTRAALALVLALLASAARADVLTYTLIGNVENFQIQGAVNGIGVSNGDSVGFQVSYDTTLDGADGFYQPNPIINIYDVTSHVALTSPPTGTEVAWVPPVGRAPFIFNGAALPGSFEGISANLVLNQANWPASGALADVRLDQLGYSSFDLGYNDLTPDGLLSFDVVGGSYQAAPATAPEPASLTLLAVGALGMAWRLRRRRGRSRGACREGDRSILHRLHFAE